MPDVTGHPIGLIFKRQSAFLLGCLIVESENDRLCRHVGNNLALKKKNSVALVRERNIPTEQPPPVGEVSANFCG